MALKVDIDTDFGVQAKYWNIGNYGEDFKGAGAEVVLFGWASKQARTDGKQPLAVRKFQFVGDDYVADMKRPDIYARVKLKAEFAASLDDLAANAG